MAIIGTNYIGEAKKLIVKSKKAYVISEIAKKLRSIEILEEEIKELEKGKLDLNRLELDYKEGYKT